MSTVVTVLEADGLTQTDVPVPDLGRQAAADSGAVVLSTEDLAAVLDIADAVREPVTELAPTPRTATRGGANVAGATSSTVLLAANTARRGGSIVNDSTAILYVKMGTGASSTSYDYLLAGSVSGIPSQMDLPGDWVGVIHGIWASATGNARVHERTA